MCWCDLDRFPYPFRDSLRSCPRGPCDRACPDVIRTMEEFHRLLRTGGTVYIATPHYTDFSSFCDPTHRWHLNSFSLRYFGEDNAGFGYYSRARFREKNVRVKLLALWRWLGFEALVNAFPRFRRFWEHYLCLRGAGQSRSSGNSKPSSANQLRARDCKSEISWSLSKSRIQ